jgi:putative toxin-antitoxin system antitoxin component (TIGR02293 family)
VELLGGPEVLGRRIGSGLEAHDLIFGGLPAESLLSLVDAASILSAHEGNLDKALGISMRTLQRRRSGASRARLSAEQSGRLWKFAELLGRATAIFGSQEEAEAWFQRPALAFDGRLPIDLLGTPAGVELVEDHLTRLEYGVYV